MMKLDKSRWQAVTPLLEELLDASALVRAERLAQLELQDPGLATDLASLLALRARVKSEGFLETSALDRFDSATRLAGKALGSYTLEREIGAGGMGTVWLAHRADGRYEGRAAVKFLNLGLLGRGGTERFRREGNALARLGHPNIAHLLDAGDLDGHPYLVIEYVEGQPIDAWCDMNFLPVAARISLLLQVFAAVAYAHSQLILHRDLKPSNILVTSAGQAKLLDFGIAKLIGDDTTPAQRTELTQVAGRALTPDYAAPEQMQGGDVSTATDVFVLGVMIYLLLSGVHPSAGARSAAERIRLLVETEPAKMSEAALRAPPEAARLRASTPLQLARALRGDLDNIVAKALKKSPAERYPTVDALAEDLRRFLSDQPVSARADSVGYRIGKFVRRHRFAVVAASAAAITLMAISTVAIWQMLEAQQQRRAAEEEAARAASAGDFLHFVLGEVGASGRPFTTQDLLAQAEKSIEGNFGSAENPIAIQQLIQIGELYSTTGQEAKALELAQNAYQLATHAGHTEVALLAACSLGKQLHLAGKLKESADLLDRTISALRARVSETTALFTCLQFRADLALTLGDVDSGVALAKEAVALATSERLRSVPASQIAPRMQLAIAYRVAGQNALANTTYRDLEAVFKRLGRERSADAVAARSNWGKLRSDMGDILGAARLIESSLALGQALRPGGSPNYMLGLNYAQRLLTLHRLDEAQRLFSQARKEAEAEDDPEMQGFAMLGLVAVQRKRGDFAAARAALTAAGDFVRIKFPDPAHRVHTALLLETGELHLASGAFAEAREELAAVAAKNEAANVRSPARALTLAALAQAEQGLGDGGHAAAHALQAAQNAEALAAGGEASYWVGHCLLVRAELEHAAGHAEAAHQLAAQSLLQLVPTVGPEHPSTRNAQTLASN
jgi:serine/threonine protein kinase